MRVSSEPLPASVFDAVGGEPAFRRHVADFYRRVRADPVLVAVYPPESLVEAEEHLALFLMQYWGGPTAYSEQRGHPRLRMRHAPFAIGEAERDAWLSHMRAALDGLALDPVLDEALWEHMHRAAMMLRNRA